MKISALRAALLIYLLLCALPVAAQEAAPAPQVYIVQPGDMLYSIAQRFGTTVEAIANANGLPDPTLIAVGQKLVIPTARPQPGPSPQPQVYVVQPGDSLSAIAQQLGTTVQAIAAANNITDPAVITVGQKLIIPPAPAPVEAPPEAPSHRRFHRTRPTETVPFLAFRYGTTIWALRAANDLGRLPLLLPGRELSIPSPTALTEATPRFPEITVSPSPVVQGQTLVVEVRSRAEMSLSGQFLGQDLLFEPGAGTYWALVGVDALTEPAGYPLLLTIEEADNGDRLTMQETLDVAQGSFTRYNVVVPADRQGLLDPTLGEAERKTVNKVFDVVTPVQQWQGTFGYPLVGQPITTAPFGQRRSYSGGPVSGYHSGLDLDGETGTPVYAPAAGTVVMAEPLQVRGRVVILDHGLGVLTGFWHLSQIDVTLGQVISRGEVVGLVGNTGLSTGSHLHWEMRVKGVPVDSLQWTRQAFP